MQQLAEVDVVRRATERLGRELAALTPGQWDRPAACGTWSVAEVIAHLVWGADCYADGIRRALVGDSAPPAGFVPIVEYPRRAAWIARVAGAYRRELGDRLADGFDRSGRALVALFEAATADDWERPAFHPSGVKTIRQLLALRIVELSVHGWEALHRAGRDLPLPDGSHGVIVDWLPTRLRPSFVRREPLPEPLRYLFVLDGPLARRVRMTISGDRIDLDPAWDDAAADAVVSLDAERFVLLMMGRNDWQEAFASGIVAVAGRDDLARAFPSWFEFA